MDKVITTDGQNLTKEHSLNEIVVEMIKDYVRFRPYLESMVQDYLRMKPYFAWLESGRPDPPHPMVKHMIIKEYRNKFQHQNMPKIFIETGTFLGDTVEAVRNDFEKIYSIELGQNLYETAKTRFSGYNHISILHGNSSEVLPEIIKNIEQPCLFWLDAHDSGGITTKAENDPPIMQEVECILNHPVKNHIILMDDARGLHLPNLRNLVLSKRPDLVFKVEDDIVRVYRDNLYH
jgi:hypothetical protein